MLVDGDNRTVRSDKTGRETEVGNKGKCTSDTKNIGKHRSTRNWRDRSEVSRTKLSGTRAINCCSLMSETNLFSALTLSFKLWTSSIDGISWSMHFEYFSMMPRIYSWIRTFAIIRAWHTILWLSSWYKTKNVAIYSPYAFSSLNTIIEVESSSRCSRLPHLLLIKQYENDYHKRP